jgi:hypothetical protein
VCAWLSAVELTAVALASLAGDQVAKGAGFVASRTKGRSQAPVGELVTSLSVEQLREVVSAAAEHHEDVERAVRLIAARDNDDLAALRAEVDRGLRTRRYLPYAESSGWAHAARPSSRSCASAPPLDRRPSWSSCCSGRSGTW